MSPGSGTSSSTIWAPQLPSSRMGAPPGMVSPSPGPVPSGRVCVQQGRAGVQQIGPHPPVQPDDRHPRRAQRRQQRADGFDRLAVQACSRRRGSPGSRPWRRSRSACPPPRRRCARRSTTTLLRGGRHRRRSGRRGRAHQVHGARTHPPAVGAAPSPSGATSRSQRRSPCWLSSGGFADHALDQVAHASRCPRRAMGLPAATVVLPPS